MRRCFPFVLAALLCISMSLSSTEALCTQRPGGKGAFEGTGRKWAFCVGIGYHRNPEIVALPKARNDAKGLAGVLQEHGGFDEVLVLTDDLEEKSPLFPSGRNIHALLQRSAPKIRKEDLVLFSFSGHGMTDASGRAFLLAAGRRGPSAGAEAIPFDTILNFLGRTGVSRSILIIDAAREKVYRKGGPSLGVYPDRFIRKGVAALFYAAGKGYFSHDDDESQYGVFTGCVIRGLGGEADKKWGGDKDGVVTLRELSSYVGDAATAWSLKGPARQIPLTEILNNEQAFMAVSSVEKIGVAKTIPIGLPAVAAVPARKAGVPSKKPDLKEGRGKRDKEAKEGLKQVAPGGKAEEPKPAPAATDAPKVAKAPPKTPEPMKAEAVRPAAEAKDTPESKPAVVVGAPAPRIKDLVKNEEPQPPKKEVRETTPAEKESKAAKPPEAVKEPAPEEVKAALAKPPVEEKAAPPAPATQKVPEKETRIPEEPKLVKEAPAPSIQAVPTLQKPPEKLAYVPPEVKKGPIRLRAKAKDLSTQEVKSMLTSRNFYATCWNYNGDFCNPDGEFENSFQDNRNGTVTDRATGLMWQKDGSKEAMSWIAAREYAEKMNKERLAGYDDWRLPTAEEMASLMKNSWRNGDLFIDPIFERTQRHCWSLDTRGMESAWKANFHMGFLMDFPMTSKNHARLVRSLQ